MNDNKREIILEHYGYSKTEGFIMDYDKPDDNNLLDVFITKEEWFEKSLEGFKTFYWNGKTERLMDLEDAWEYMIEDQFHLTTMTDTKLEDYLEKLYAKLINKVN